SARERAEEQTRSNTTKTGARPERAGGPKDGRHRATANEGEPNSDYSIDPEGSVTLVDLSKGINNADVTQIGFGEFDGVRSDELPKAVRISGPNASIVQDL
ncbi:hypothetical protein OFN94_28940, partial [Escherichia coli]|nr:hypothetical protein [Escherichia coli]